MIALFYGSDVTGVRAKARTYIHKLTDKGRTLERISAENYEHGMIASVLGSESLFGGSQVVELDMPSEDQEMQDELQTLLSDMKTSVHVFVCIEAALKAVERKAYEKHAELMEEVQGEKLERFNTFALADALGGRDKRRLWLLLIQAKNAGVSSEEIIGVLFWQAKTILLAHTCTSAEDAGLKQFVYQKAKRAKFSKDEATVLSGDLLRIYHDGHTGKRNIESALEAWVLGL
jgi:DNA polymerase III delta subunit